MPQGTWKIARGKSSAQLPLAIVAVLAVVLVLVGKAQSSLFNSLRAEFTDYTAPALKVARGPLDSASQWAGSIGDIFHVYQENLKLREENARLRQWQSAALLLQQRLKRYQLLLNAVPDPALKSVTAHVIGRATRPFLDTMILDAGKQQGVTPGEAVVDPRGVVGRIFLAGQRTSWVILLTDLNSRIPVRTVGSHVMGILSGDNTPAPVLDTVTDPARLQPGDQVVTSGDGGLLPPDLPVGIVVKDGNLLRVALFADPASSEDVDIVDFKHPIEQPPPVTLNDLPASALPPPVKPPAEAPEGSSAVTAAGSGPGATAPSQVLQPVPKPLKPGAQPGASGATR